MDDVIIVFFATVLIWFLFFGLVILWFIDGKVKKEQVLHALLAVTLSWVVILVVKHFFPTLRPYMLNGEDIDVLLTPKDGSFPSQHTAFAFSLAVTIFLHDRKIGAIYLISAILIGVARVIANVHYPIDILGGALLGTLIALVVDNTHLFNLLTKHKKYL